MRNSCPNLVNGESQQIVRLCTIVRVFDLLYELTIEYRVAGVARISTFKRERLRDKKALVSSLRLAALRAGLIELGDAFGVVFGDFESKIDRFFFNAGI
jgi:hypothetical protein